MGKKGEIFFFPARVAAASVDLLLPACAYHTGVVVCMCVCDQGYNRPRIHGWIQGLLNER